MEATKTFKTKKVKTIGKHERCPICKYPFGTGTCDTCRDPKCDECGIRLLTCEREVGAKCVKCSPEAEAAVKAASKLAAKDKTRIVAIAVTD
jgi:hypothetical protein